MYNPQRKKGRCPKLDSKWMGPCRVLERLSEVVYRVQLPLRGRKVALHRDRLAPYRGTATPLRLETGAQGVRDTVRSSPQFPSDVPCSLSSSLQSGSFRLFPFLAPDSTLAGPPSAAGPLRPQRNRRPPDRLGVFVVPSGTRDFEGGR